MSSTTTKSSIGGSDIKWYDGTTDTFTRKTSTGGDLTLYKIGHDVDVAMAYGTGAASEAALTAAVAGIGSTNKRRIVLKAGTWNITADLTIPANVTILPLPGAVLTVATTKTLTINGPIEAGLYQIFSWAGTGAIALGSSQTADIPMTWFGAVSGTSSDQAAIYSKITDSIGSHQTIYFPKGTWRIATATTITGNTYGLKHRGDGKQDTQLWIDTTGAIGLTYGAAGSDHYQLEFKELSITGPASACTYAIKAIRCHDIIMDEVNFHVGATQYALWLEGCLWPKLNVEACRWTYAGSGLPANCIKITDEAAAAYATNIVEIYAIISGNATGNGIYADCPNGGASTVLKISGSIENCTGYPVYAENFAVVDIANMYLVDANSYGPYIKDCKTVRLANLDCTNDTGIVSKLENVWGGSINNCRFDALTIDSQCRGITLSNCEVASKNGLVDNTPDTQIFNLRYRDGGFAESSLGGKLSDRRNYIENAGFARWASTTPDGWTHDGTATQCGTGLVDTTNHGTKYCTKLVNNGSNSTIVYTVDAYALLALKNKVANFSIWQNLVTGSFTNYPIIYLDPTVPAWVAATAYSIGDAVIPTAGDAGYMYVCIVAGTSHAATEPTWLTTVSATQTDGTVTWKVYDTQYTSFGAMPGVAADKGVWKKVTTTGFIPRNTSALTCSFYLQRKDGPANATVYLSEPALIAGYQGPDAVILGQNEHNDFIQIAANRQTYGTGAPGAGYGQEGDIVWHSAPAVGQPIGWMCSVSGSPGTWVALANL